jgi:DNA-binding response OmpR family regulator
VVVPEKIESFQIPFREPVARTIKHLLIVNDEPLIRDLLRKYLESERYTVDLAQDAQEAWRKLADMEYDCILLDLKMPGMSGQQLYELMEDSRSDLTSKIIFITGDTMSPETRDFLSRTGNPSLSKPFRLDELLREVKNFECQPMKKTISDRRATPIVS